MIVQKKPGARAGMTLQSSPNYFSCSSQRRRWITRGTVIPGSLNMGVKEPDTIRSQPPYHRQHKYGSHSNRCLICGK